MKESEAIKEFRQNIDMPFGSNISREASELAIQTLEEVQQYRAIGTPEECRKAVEKQIPQKPSNESLDGLNCFPICPNCHQGLNEDERESFCECGQRLDWSGSE